MRGPKFTPEESIEIRRILKEVRAALPQEGPVVLTAEYLRLVERVEALPANRPGSDKSPTLGTMIRWRNTVRGFRLVPLDGE